MARQHTHRSFSLNGSASFLFVGVLQLVVLRYSIEVKKQTGEWVRRKIHEELEVPIVMDVSGCCTEDCQIASERHRDKKLHRALLSSVVRVVGRLYNRGEGDSRHFLPVCLCAVSRCLVFVPTRVLGEERLGVE